MDPLRLGQRVARLARSRLTRRAALASGGAGLATALLDRLGVGARADALAQDATPTAADRGRQPATRGPGLDADAGRSRLGLRRARPRRGGGGALVARPGRQLLAAGRPARHAHAQCPLLRGPLRRHPGHRPGRAPAAGPRPGRAADALHDGRSQALPVGLGRPLPGVLRQLLLRVAGGVDGADGPADRTA